MESAFARLLEVPPSSISPPVTVILVAVETSLDNTRPFLTYEYTRKLTGIVCLKSVTAVISVPFVTTLAKIVEFEGVEGCAAPLATSE